MPSATVVLDPELFAIHRWSQLEQLLTASADSGASGFTLGYELEGALVSPDRQLAPLSEVLLARVRRDPGAVAQPVSEVTTFSFELNGAVRPATPEALRDTSQEMLAAVQYVNRILGRDGLALLVGLPPMLQLDHLTASWRSAQLRYELLEQGLKRFNDGRYTIDLPMAKGAFCHHPPSCSAIGAGHAFQIHLGGISTADYPAFYQAAQLVTALGVAASGNSPYLAGHPVGSEGRILLFEQITRTTTRTVPLARRNRTPLGYGWLSNVRDIYAASLEYPTLVPLLGAESGKSDPLFEWRLGHSMMWPWVRPTIYNSTTHAGLELGIEFRAFATQPTVIDNLATAAYVYGLTFYLAQHMPYLVGHGLSFAACETALHQAARHGLRATVQNPSIQDRSRVSATGQARDVILSTMERAYRGLKLAGLASSFTDYLLEIVARRVQTGAAGATWQTRRVQELLNQGFPLHTALDRMCDQYLGYSFEERPLHTWP